MANFIHVQDQHKTTVILNADLITTIEHDTKDNLAIVTTTAGSKIYLNETVDNVWKKIIHDGTIEV